MKQIRLAATSAALAIAICLSGCGESEFRHPDTRGYEVDLTVRPFFQDLFAKTTETSAERAVRLKKDYGGYFETFGQYVIRIGHTGDASFNEGLRQFLAYDENSEVIAACDSVFPSRPSDGEVSDAFSCFHALFPDAIVPSAVYAHFSGFGDKLFIDSTFVSFSVEHYLGENCRFYDWLEIPRYARRTRSMEHLTADLVKAWIYGTMPDESGKDDILSAMIYQAKVLYCTHCCLPDISTADLFGYTAEQMKWCEKNEASVWAYLVSHKLLYSTNVLERNKLVNEAPFTSFFGNTSPDRAAVFCAYNIVRQFMGNTPGMTPDKLMKQHDAQAILQGAKYNPK